MTKKQLIAFEEKLANLCKQGKIHVPVHLSGSINGRLEDHLITLFKHWIKPGDYVFSTHRNHYHYLLKGGKPHEIMHYIKNTDMGSMHIINPRLKFYSSAIVGGNVAIATGVAKALKMEKSKDKVFCFIGDGATDQGWFAEAVKYSITQELPILFVLEDNDRSVGTSKDERWGGRFGSQVPQVMRIWHTPKYAHAGPNRENIPL